MWEAFVTRIHVSCQSALDWDPGSARKRDPSWGCPGSA
jgi:hypothetical protein